MDRLTSRLPFLEIGLWILGIAVAVIIFIAFAPGFVAVFAGSATPTPTPLPKATATPRATWTAVPTWTGIPLPPPVTARTPLPVPTPPANAKEFSFNADPKRSGWLTNKETGIHWGDRNLHAGVYREQVFQTLLYFDVSNVVPGSKILYAQVELVGLNRTNLGAPGDWTLRLLPADLLANWTQRPSKDFRDASPQADIGSALKPEDLAEDRVNQFIFAPAQLARLEEMATNTGLVAFRLDGPAGASESLFTWDAGDRDPKIGVHPMLRLIVVPDQYIYITQTPTPQNVLTAAAIVATATEFTQRFGTPTPFPRKYATMLPLLPITPVPTPANAETATARVMYATAVAMTTGTLTPTPLHWVTTTPVPLVIPAQNLSPTPMPTRTPTPLPIPQSAKRTIPADLYNKIIFQRGPRYAPTIWVMDPDGKNLGLVTDLAVYETVAARDTISPDGIFALFNATDPNRPDTLQILRSDLRLPLAPPTTMTALRAGIAFAPAWSPDGTKIAYASTETGRHEIWILDANTRVTKQITFSTDWFWNQFPSWSPDGKQIVFSSDRGHNGAFTEIWVMNADGTRARKLGDDVQDAWGPVWIKSKQ
ncbi:MAG: PD40 domain-containing protein [Chloroflexi bacterium]|nr:PD40 domain-containing protein [Chloroflexota bacterium]